MAKAKSAGSEQASESAGAASEGSSVETAEGSEIVGVAMQVVMLLTTWTDGITTIAPGQLWSFPVAEAERLVAIGSASNPEAPAEVVVADEVVES